jgi:hypothetical protein
MKRTLKKLAYKKEPVLHVHRYVIALYRKSGKVGYWYAMNLKEARERARNAKPGTIVEIFRATHNFIQVVQVK